jgi:phenylalanyl-tRNA synthetase beta chain
MKFRTKDLENYLQKKLDWQKIAQELTLKSFETKLEDDILEVDILPNRYADASSLIGLAKEISVLTGIKFKEPKIYLKESLPLAKNYFDVKIETNLVPYYLNRIILNVNNQESPKWLKEFVEFYGFNSINFLVDLSNFVMIEYGAPLHIFDLDKIKGGIIVRLAKKGEEFISLDNKKYKLKGEEIVIADKEKILALGGIKGGKGAEVSLETKNIIIEAAVFDPTKIYSTSRNLNLKTDASFRFERKVSPYRSLLALNRLTSLIQQNLGGKILKGIINFKTLKPVVINFDYNKVEKISGLKFEKEKIKKILTSIGCKINNKKITIPFERLDLNSEEDLVEEVLRIYGLNNINPLKEETFNEIAVDPIIEFNEKITDILTKVGYNQAHNYSFISKEDKETFQQVYQSKLVEVLNPISENYSYFRGSLLPNLLKAVYLNQFKFKEIKLFEIGKVAEVDKKIKENYSLGVVIASKEKKNILEEIKGLLTYLEKEFQIKFDFKEESENNIFSLWAKIFLNNEFTGLIGLFTRKILDDYLIDLNVATFEINLNILFEKVNLQKKFKQWPIFAVINRDISFFVEEKIKFSFLKKEIEKMNFNYLKNIELLDIYFSPEKSMTLRLTFFDNNRNLQENEVDKEFKKIKEFLVQKFKVKLR